LDATARVDRRTGYVMDERDNDPKVDFLKILVYTIIVETLIHKIMFLIIEMKKINN
jgi:hypothetical protein